MEYWKRGGLIMFDFLKKILSGRSKRKQSVEELRKAFKERYGRFRSLLQANNRVLDIMAEMQQALDGTEPFGITFVRERCAKACQNVGQIVDDMRNLAPEKYDALSDKLREIQEKIDALINSESPGYGGPLALSLAQFGKEYAGRVGGKMANLGEIKNHLDLRVPDGFVITTAGYHSFREHNQLLSKIEKLRNRYTDLNDPKALHSLSDELQRIIRDSAIPPDLEASILQQYRSLEQTYGKGVKLAVRSSALGEDIPNATAAGQYHSSLNVCGGNIMDAFKEVFASAYSPGAITYRMSLGMGSEDVEMCVGCVKMVEAVAGGVMYSRNPLDIEDDSILIDSVWGLPKPVVDGTSKTDHFVISRGSTFRIKKKEISIMEQMCVSSPDGGVEPIGISRSQGEQASITDEQACELAKLAVRMEDHFQAPQDTEWCVDGNGSIVILQSRTLKQVNSSKQRDDPAGEEKICDRVIVRGGITAAPGAAAGAVFTVRDDIDAIEFPKDAVLLVDQALPQWATLLTRAAAVVSECGGMGGHLATMAREFGVPALFSVEGAIEQLKPGRLVTVDADGLRVCDGKVAELLRAREGPTNVMASNPAYKALASAMEYIVPLNLLDHDDPSFAVKNCRTLHDITRFCHEKSVHEMFSFGKSHHFPERSGKRLYINAPMKWLVLNLDDGFTEEVKGRFVKLENIASTPMLALWDGIAAVPWDGPPAIDGRGLASVMFQATQNRDLIVGTQSKYADTHYFMISKKYCCLNARFGVHFCGVEAMVGDRPNENYASFRFTGGAADYDRRRRRILFMKEILERFHFRVDIKKDNLVARVEGYDQDFMIRSLKIIGYLTVHTRQLDMIMSNPAKVSYHMDKIFKDIQGLSAEDEVLYVYLDDEE